MKRFYTQVAVTDDLGIALDGKPVRTPGRAALVLPTRALAEAIAAEWAAQGETIAPLTMPLTGLANAAIDVVAPAPMGFADGLAKYGESDLLCYRADGPDSLVAAQAAAWDPLLGWAARRYDIAFNIVTGVIHRPQPPRTIAALAAATAAWPPFALAGLSPLVTIGGSLVATLGVAEGAFAADAVWDAVTVDERWQAEQWGADALAEAALAARRGAFLAGAGFVAMLG